MFGRLQKIVLVSGSPGAGKTTLAVPLAQALNFGTLIDVDTSGPVDILALAQQINNAWN